MTSIRTNPSQEIKNYGLTTNDILNDSTAIPLRWLRNRLISLDIDSTTYYYPLTLLPPPTTMHWHCFHDPLQSLDIVSTTHWCPLTVSSQPITIHLNWHRNLLLSFDIYSITQCYFLQLIPHPSANLNDSTIHWYPLILSPQPTAVRWHWPNSPSLY